MRKEVLYWFYILRDLRHFRFIAHAAHTRKPIKLNLATCRIRIWAHSTISDNRPTVRANYVCAQEA